MASKAKPQQITSPFDVKSHAIACKIIGKDPKKVTSLHEQLDDWANAINKIDKFKPSFKKEDQQKWYPWYYVDASGLRFDYSHFGDSDSYSDVGSRLCIRFRNREISDFYGKAVEKIQRKIYYGKK